MVKSTLLFLQYCKGFSPFLNFFMVKCFRKCFKTLWSFSPFLNFFMVKLHLLKSLNSGCFSPF
ncbi:hypothetical protein FJM36_06880, partial [Campylobacter coli]|nr:hypothetical protein [Campylobacter coli]